MVDDEVVVEEVIVSAPALLETTEDAFSSWGPQMSQSAEASRRNEATVRGRQLRCESGLHQK